MGEITHPTPLYRSACDLAATVMLWLQVRALRENNKVSKSTIWIGFVATVENQSNFTPAPGGSPELFKEFQEEADRGIASLRKVRKGESISVEEVNSRIYWFTPGRAPFPGVTPPIISNAGIFLRSDVVDLLREFDTGEAQFFPVEIFDNDRLHPTGARVWFVNPRNLRSTVNPLASVLRQPRVGKKVLSYFLVPRNLPADHLKVVTNRAAMDGSDLWIDPILPEAWFFSDRLALRLVEAGLKDAFRLFPTTTVG